MNSALLHTNVQKFLIDKADIDVVSLILQKQVFEQVSNKELATQLVSRKKTANKLPTWFAQPQIYYPAKIHIEQTSSELTANYKASLVSGQTLVDATGGFGVDSYFFSQTAQQVVHCEINKELSEIATHNFKMLLADNIEALPVNGLEYIQYSSKNFDWIYLDPSRRNEVRKKVFLLENCLPNVPDNLNLLFTKTDNILLKTSPLLDFSVGIIALKYVKEIHVVAIKNEVKELLWILCKGYAQQIKVNTVNFKSAANYSVDNCISDADTFNFLISEEPTASKFSAPLSYLYEPNAAIMKSGAFNLISSRLNVFKLHENTHIYIPLIGL